jgi:hypothetical protein
MKNQYLREQRNLMPVLLLVFLTILASPRPCTAYTDPGSGLLLWQTLSAAGVGLLFYFHQIFRKLRSRNSRGRPGSESEVEPKR